MTLDQAMEKIKALWPDHDVMQTPLSAKGMLKILEELGLIKFGEEEFSFDAELVKAILNVEHPNNPPIDEIQKALFENSEFNPESIETVEVTPEQLKGSGKGLKIKDLKGGVKDKSIVVE